ncbi:hypothetical protein KKF55_01365 [Patescibacteria group bacterium]|nr:hypothetical protein [Patescibacteria group bacterium]
MTLEATSTDKCEMRILDNDAHLVWTEPHKTGNRAWDGEIEVKGDDLQELFGDDIHSIGFGTKSCLAQLGVFLSIKHRGKTREQDIDVTKHKITARVKGSTYSHYDIELLEGDKVGRFFHQVGNAIPKPQVEKIMAKTKAQGKLLYTGDTESIGNDGEIILLPRQYTYKVNPNNERAVPYRVQSRRDLEKLEKENEQFVMQVNQDEQFEIQQGNFIVTDTDRIQMPYDYAGLLVVDQIGDMAMPTHLNSPIVDPGYGQKEGDGNLRLELYQPHPYPELLREVFVRMYIFRGKVIKLYQSNGQSNDQNPDKITGIQEAIFPNNLKKMSLGHRRDFNPTPNPEVPPQECDCEII